MKNGDVIRISRIFTREDVRQFVAVTGDDGEHHVKADEQGRVIVQGLLTASLATKIGGALNFLARTMDFEFKRPVYTGERIECLATIDELEQARRGTRLRVTTEFRNPAGDLVLRGQGRGTILKSLAEIESAPLPRFPDSPE